MTHGWLNIDKPIGISSTQAVTRIKKIFGVKKAGHLGTLDPLATGVLPVALGEATKTIPYLSCNLKSYDFTVKWGEQRTTDDLNGEIVKTSSIKPEYNQIECAIKNFIGEVTQTPPQFSAIKINGVRSYKLARRGKNANIKPRIVQIHDLKLISMNFENNSADFSMVCGDGVYVRSIARDLGAALNCFGYVAKLRRTMVGNFKESEAITIDQLTQKGKIIPITSILDPMLKIEISSEDAEKIRNGKSIVLNYLRNFQDCDICYVVVGSVPVAICSFIYGCVKPIRVFNI